MPIYEYKCTKCGCRFEVRQDFDDEPITQCQNNGCDGLVRRVFSPPAIIFKGSGFYVTDNRHGDSKQADKKPSDSSPSSDNETSRAETD